MSVEKNSHQNNSIIPIRTTQGASKLTSGIAQAIDLTASYERSPRSEMMTEEEMEVWNTKVQASKPQQYEVML